jgi:isoamylase
MSMWASAEGAILSLGSTWIEEERAYNFSLYARHADGVTLYAVKYFSCVKLGWSGN